MIRQYNLDDYVHLKSWAEAQGITTLTPSLIPSSTFVGVSQDKPVVSLSLLLTNNNEYAFLEYALGDPKAKGPIRQLLFKGLVQYIEQVAKGLGLKKLLCLAPHPDLERYYSEFGYQPNLRALTLMAKELN